MVCNLTISKRFHLKMAVFTTYFNSDQEEIDQITSGKKTDKLYCCLNNHLFFISAFL
jgi:hypothetical protein